MCVHRCVCMWCVGVTENVYMCKWAYVPGCLSLCAHVCVHVWACMCSCVLVCVHARVYMCMCMCMHTDLGRNPPRPGQCLESTKMGECEDGSGESSGGPERFLSLRLNFSPAH